MVKYNLDQATAPAVRRRVRCAVTASVKRDLYNISATDATGNVRITCSYTYFRESGRFPRPVVPTGTRRNLLGCRSSGGSCRGRDRVSDNRLLLLALRDPLRGSPGSESSRSVRYRIAPAPTPDPGRPSRTGGLRSSATAHPKNLCVMDHITGRRRAGGSTISLAPAHITCRFPIPSPAAKPPLATQDWPTPVHRDCQRPWRHKPGQPPGCTDADLHRPTRARRSPDYASK